MSDLLDLVLDAHGGLERWRQVRRLIVYAQVGGGTWGRCGRERVLSAHIELDPHAQRLVFHGYPAPDRRGVFDVSRTAIETADGEVIDERTDPVAAFENATPTSSCDNLRVLYTAGRALWNDLTTPFVLAMPGVRTEEIEAWEEAGEHWRRLRAVFPDGFVTQAPEQVCFFNGAGLLRRYDYPARALGVPATATYAADHKEFGGLVIATRRRAVPSDSDGRSRREPLFMTLDVLGAQVDYLDLM